MAVVTLLLLLQGFIVAQASIGNEIDETATWSWSESAENHDDNLVIRVLSMNTYFTYGEYGDVDMQPMMDILNREQPDIALIQDYLTDTHNDSTSVTNDVVKALKQNGWSHCKTTNIIASKTYNLIPVRTKRGYGSVCYVQGAAVTVANLFTHSREIYADCQKWSIKRAYSRDEHLGHWVDRLLHNRALFQGNRVILGGSTWHSHLDWINATADHHCGVDHVWNISKLLEDYHFVDTYRVTHPDPVEDPGINAVSRALTDDRENFILVKKESNCNVTESSNVKVPGDWPYFISPVVATLSCP